MRVFPRVVASALVSYIALVSPCSFERGDWTVRSACAQTTAAAEALYERGLEAMLAGRYDEACPALAESHRLDPKPGALFTLAECENKAGKLATAAAHYDDYLRTFDGLSEAQQASQRGREGVARDARERLKVRIPRLTITLAAGSPPDAKVFIDGVELGAPSLGIALPVDPGDHEIRAEAPGRSVTNVMVPLKEGENNAVEIVLTAPAAEQTPASQPVTPKEAPTEEGGLMPVALVVGGVGIAGIVVGAVTGGLVFSKKSTVDDNCQDNVCNAEGIDAVDSADTLGLVSTIGFAAGAALVATSVVLLLVDGSEQEASAEAGPPAGRWRVVPGFSQAGATVFLDARF